MCPDLVWEEWNSQRGMESHLSFVVVGVVEHLAKESGISHTNQVETFFSLSIKGKGFNGGIFFL